MNLPDISTIQHAVIEQPVDNGDLESRKTALKSLVRVLFGQLGQHVKFLANDAVAHVEWITTLADDYKVGTQEQLDCGLAHVKRMAKEAGGKIEIDVHRFGVLCHLLHVNGMPSPEEAYAEAQRAAHDPVWYANYREGYSHWGVYLAGKGHWAEIRGDYGMKNDDHNKAKQDFIKRYARCQYQASKGADLWHQVPKRKVDSMQLEYQPIEGEEKAELAAMLRAARQSV